MGLSKIDRPDEGGMGENAHLFWPKQMKRHDGYCERADHPEDKGSAQEFMTDQHENYDIIHFLDENKYHVVCIDGSPVGGFDTLLAAQSAAQDDYTTIRVALYGLPQDQLIECDVLHCGEMFDHVRCDGTLNDGDIGRSRKCLCTCHRDK